MIEELIGLVIIVGSAVGAQWRLARFVEARVAAQDALEEERRKALYKQQKATATAVAQSDRAVRKLVAETTNARADALQLQRQADALLSHPTLKRIIAREEERNG